MRSHASGSITVYLTLVMVIILSFIGSILDLARMQIADTYAYRALVSAVDAEFSKYCSELYEDYHIYMITKNCDPIELSNEELAQSISDYLRYSFDPDYTVSALGYDINVTGSDSFELELNDCNVINEMTLLTNNSELFQDQIADYMKYHISAAAAESILNKLDIMQNSKKTMEVVRKKNEIEEKVAKIDKKILDLMSEVEGIVCSDTGIEVTGDYEVEIEDSFAKKFCITEVTPNNVGINHNVIWDSIQEEYINPISEIDALLSHLEKCKMRQAIDEEIAEIEKKNIGEQDKLEIYYEWIEEGKWVDVEKVTKLEEVIKGYENQLEELSKEGKEYKNYTKNKVDAVLKEDGGKLCNQATKVYAHIKEAMTIIEEIKDLKDESKGDMQEFEGYIASKQGELDQETYLGIQQEFSSLKEYVDRLDENGVDTSVVGNIIEMYHTLQTNKNAIEQTIKLTDMFDRANMLDVDAIMEQLNNVKRSYDSYSIKPLQFDYTTLSLEEEEDSPFDIFQTLIGDGFYGLVFKEVDALSEVSIEEMDLPSKGMIEEEVEDNQAQDLSECLDGPNEESGVSDSMKSYEEDCESIEVKSSAPNDIARYVLLREYGCQMFGHYEEEKKKEAEGEQDEATQTETTGEKETVMTYEQEYLIAGKMCDEDNVKCVVLKTIFIRAALNYLSLLGDATCKGYAQVTATALVGFTGFAPLITVTKHLILFTWAFEESLVEVRGLLIGKEISLMKKAKEFSIRYPELLLLSKALIQQKASALPDKGSNALGLSYEDYVRLYLCMVGDDTLSYRMMDLIQCNMRARYNQKFLIADGIFGAKVSMNTTLEAKFLHMPGMSFFSQYGLDSVNIHTETEYSY